MAKTTVIDVALKLKRENAALQASLAAQSDKVAAENARLRKLVDMNQKVVDAARELREAQKAYMADRGNNDKGKAVAAAAAVVDEALRELDANQGEHGEKKPERCEHDVHGTDCVKCYP